MDLFDMEIIELKLIATPKTNWEAHCYILALLH